MNKEENEDGEVEYKDLTDGMTVEMGAVITSVKKIATKSGQTMLAVVLEDLYGSCEGVIFPKLYDKLKDLAEVDSVVKVKGKLQIRDEREPSIIIDDISLLSGGAEKTTFVPKKQYLGLKFNGQSADEVQDILLAYPGDITVIFKIDGKNMVSSTKIRKCNGLINELLSIFDEQDIVFFEK